MTQQPFPALMPAEGASGAINQSSDMIDVVLEQPNSMPAVIRIAWPQ